MWHPDHECQRRATVAGAAGRATVAVAAGEATHQLREEERKVHEQLAAPKEGRRHKTAAALELCQPTMAEHAV